MRDNLDTRQTNQDANLVKASFWEKFKRRNFEPQKTQLGLDEIKKALGNPALAKALECCLSGRENIIDLSKAKTTEEAKAMLKNSREAYAFLRKIGISSPSILGRK